LSDQPLIYLAQKQRGYHSSSPFVKSGPVLDEMVRLISQLSAAVKYAHSEVGYLERVESEVTEINGKTAEQMEIEFLPEPVEECAEHLVLAAGLSETSPTGTGWWPPSLRSSKRGWPETDFISIWS